MTADAEHPREMRIWTEERRARARQAREVAAEMITRHSALRQRVDLLAVALKLQRLSNGRVVA